MAQGIAAAVVISISTISPSTTSSISTSHIIIMASLLANDPSTR